MRFPLPILAAALSLGAFSGCSTVLSTPRQKVPVSSRPAGATVRVDGERKGRTPTQVELFRGRDHDITLSLAGYRSQTVHLTRHASPWNWGNVLHGFVPGILIDAKSGAIYKLKPAEVEVDLFPAGVRRRPLPESAHHGAGH